MYFFYIDESGNRDVKVNEPYVLAAVGMYEGQWDGFNKHLNGMKTNIARSHTPDIRQDELEVKASLVTKPKARKNSRFFNALTEDDISHISDHYLSQLERSKMVIIASVIDKNVLYEETTSTMMHRKADEMLLERIQRFMWHNHRKHNALVIMDDMDPKLNRATTLMHARLLGIGNDNMHFRNIIEYPFFVSSELSNGVQLADLIAYTINHTFKHDKPEYPYWLKIHPHISRHVDNQNVLAGLKVWPDTGRFSETFKALQTNEQA